ncbi:MAG: tetratricopeptide repeat protein [Cytophagia bacterium]|nr:MAG: tetratricopeptide repeat protein [Cytophagales bacterium]TAG07074.1 MAG: tetratricopeptide repeat protein [Cytophagia bacterium]TAG42176.1 MAG: tetratricopeptide repeat protein [Cytophagia bacterium]
MKNLLFIFFLVFSVFFQLPAQNEKKLDSLEKQTKIYNKEDSIQLKMYLTISKISLGQGQTSKSLEYSDKCIALSEKLDIKKYISLAYIDRSYLLFILGEYPQATQAAKKSIDIAEEIKNENLIANNYQVLGKIYEGQGKYKEVLDLYEKTLAIYQKKDNHPNLSFAYNNLGNINAMMGNYQKALDYQQKALEIRQKNPEQLPNLTYSYNDIAYIYTAQGKYKEALNYQIKAMENAIKYKDKLYLNFGYVNLAEAYFSVNDFSKALEYAKKGLEYAKKANTKQSIASSYNLLARIQKNLKNYEKALEYQEFFVVYRDSILNENQQKELTKIENNFKYDKQKKENELLKKEQLIRDAKITQLLYIVLFSFFGAILLVLLILFLYRNNRLKQKNNNILTEKNEEINQQNEEIRQIADNLHEVNEKVKQQNHLITVQNEDLLGNITYAQRIQEAILPTKEYIKQYLEEYFIFFKPKDIVSGDFYFFQEIDNQCIFAAIDCTGHGVSGAFMTILANDILNNIINNQKIIQADQILNHLHKDIRKALKQAESTNRDGMDMALVIIDKKNKKIQFAGAKNSLIYIQNQTLTQIKGDRLPIGGEQKEAERLFTLHHIDCSVPTYFYLFSDGFQDQFGGENREKFMISRFKSILLENHEKDFVVQKQILEDTLQQWIASSKQETQIDDILVIGAKI